MKLCNKHCLILYLFFRCRDSAEHDPYCFLYCVCNFKRGYSLDCTPKLGALPSISPPSPISVPLFWDSLKFTVGIYHSLQTVKCLLIYPNPESALNEEAGKLLLEQYQDYFSRAQMMTEIHARPSRTTLPGLRTDQTGSASSSSTSASSSSSLGADSAVGGVAAGKKRAAEALDRKKKDKKKALKRL